MNDHNAESHNDLRISVSMRLEKLYGAEAMTPQFFLAKEPECIGASVMYNYSNFLLHLRAYVYSCLYSLYFCKYPYTYILVLY